MKYMPDQARGVRKHVGVKRRASLHNFSKNNTRKRAFAREDRASVRNIRVATTALGGADPRNRSNGAVMRLIISQWYDCGGEYCLVISSVARVSCEEKKEAVSYIECVVSVSSGSIGPRVGKLIQPKVWYAREEPRGKEKIGGKVWDPRSMWSTRSVSRCHIWRWSSGDVSSRDPRLYHRGSRRILFPSRVPGPPLCFAITHRRSRFSRYSHNRAEIRHSRAESATTASERAERTTRLRAWPHGIYLNARVSCYSRIMPGPE